MVKYIHYDMVPVWDEDDFGNGIKIIEIWILKK